MLFADISLKLKQIKVDLQKVGYVICMDKLLMEAFYISSKDELLDLIEESDLIGFMNSPRKLILVDQGEMEVTRVVNNSELNPMSYFVHAHMSDSHIHLKLKDVVDTTGSNEGVPESSIIFI